MHKTTAPKPILVYADDDEDDLYLVKDALSPYENSLAVHLFPSGQEAYDFLLELEKTGEKPCLIILDMNMPALSGRNLLPILRSLPFFNDVPIALFTTSNSEHDYHFALTHNAGFITKPVTYTQMNLVAEQLLSHCSRETWDRIKGIDSGR